MSKSVQKMRGALGFEEYYSAIFGARWQNLKAALLQEPTPVGFYAGAQTYYLDRASILAALTLPLENAQNILDMCAAPGGKTLVLANRMENTANLVSNERSFERKCRLERVVAEHLPESVKARVKITCGDGAVLCKKQTDFYDAILLDAPCSSERHVLTSPKYLEQWSPARLKTLAMEQWALLSSAFRLLKAGGYLLYSTCALSQEENSGVIKRLLKKFGAQASVLGKGEILELQSAHIQKSPALFDGIELPAFEENEYGFNILPDTQNGAGPIYFSLVKKI